MAAPKGYSPGFSFSGFQASAPSTPLPAPRLDGELANIAAAVASIILAVNDVRRADGKLNNGIVTFDSLEQGRKLLVDPTNGQLVAAAVAQAQASLAAAAASSNSANTSATNASARSPTRVCGRHCCDGRSNATDKRRLRVRLDVGGTLRVIVKTNSVEGDRLRHIGRRGTADHADQSANDGTGRRQGAKEWRCRGT
ncbi:hypothetical protein H8B02_18580 [Bradyrhizobium sp. Pear77]|uniref:hypothetical protein n=1 Tax=Bradyrhizobium altum TaxID=1571202 RepID=UPI001E4671B3|nr:hypothetical protein [Bradyrhizobium altum]MCC8955368.1 hypothetical protein [Bradyrhizobium altum]